jgi:hypothetical protein
MCKPLCKLCSSSRDDRDDSQFAYFGLIKVSEVGDFLRHTELVHVLLFDPRVSAVTSRSWTSHYAGDCPVGSPAIINSFRVLLKHNRKVTARAHGAPCCWPFSHRTYRRAETALAFSWRCVCDRGRSVSRTMLNPNGRQGFFGAGTRRCTHSPVPNRSRVPVLLRS